MRSSTAVVGFIGFLSILSLGMSKAPAKTETKLETIWVSRADGGQSCSPETAQSIEAGAKELSKAGVRVLAQRKASDGKMHMQMCGAPTGSENAYEISKDDLAKAEKQGFVAKAGN